MPTPNPKHIAIIGAGAAGLSTAATLLSEGFNPTIFEATSTVGGTWVYSSTPSPYTSLYESLRCNLPHHVMAFRNRPFPPNSPSFASHDLVHTYLKHYAKETGVLPLVRFNTRVTNVENSAGGWRVDVDRDGGGVFDAVVVAVGQYTVPNPWMPEGIEEFVRGGAHVSHSHVYKTPKGYQGKTVLVIGAGPSGIDIGLEIAEVANKVYVSHANWRQRMFGGSVEEVAKVQRLMEGGIVVLEGEVRIVVDDILCCTGYLYEYPFLKQDVGGVRVGERGRVVKGLVGHLYARKEPTLAFMGLVWKVIPFPLMEDQAKFLAAMWGGRIDRKRLESFEKAEDADWEAGMMGEKRFLHRLGPKQWEYRRRLANVSGAAMPDAVHIEIMKDSAAARKRDPKGYREREYFVLGSGAEDWRVYVDDIDITGTEDPGPIARDTPAFRSFTGIVGTPGYDLKTTCFLLSTLQGGMTVINRILHVYRTLGELSAHAKMNISCRSLSGITAASSCVGCEGIGEALKPDEVERNRALLIPDWKPNEDFTRLKRSLRTKNFAVAMEYINKIGEIAEAEQHHPDIAIYSWNHVDIVLWTHALGGVTENDLIMAVKIDTIPVALAKKKALK